MPKVAILVAAYNAEQTLPQCLDSLCHQTLQDIEILCVDDCSTDDTALLLRTRARLDNRIRVFQTPKNSGQAVARNLALQEVQAPLVCMVDADDWLSADALQSACDVFEQYPLTDCCTFHLREHYEDGHEEDFGLPTQLELGEALSGKEAFELCLDGWQLHGLYVTRTDLHRQFPFDTTTRLYSDDNTTRIHYLHARQVRTCSGVYFYLQHPASVTHRVSVRRFDYLRANESMLRQMRECGADNRLLDIYENVRWLNVVDLYMFYYQHRRELAPHDRRFGLAEIKRVWKNIDLRRLTPRNRLKFGYAPLRPFWGLFRLEEEVYFSLRFFFKGR